MVQEPDGGLAVLASSRLKPLPQGAQVSRGVKIPVGATVLPHQVASLPVGAALCCEEAITGKEDFLPFRPLRSTRLLLLICACLEVGADNVGAALAAKRPEQVCICDRKRGGIQKSQARKNPLAS